MSRREASRPPVRAVYRAIMAPESGADLVPLAPAPVPGRPGGTDSLDRLTPDDDHLWPTANPRRAKERPLLRTLAGLGESPGHVADLPHPDMSSFFLNRLRYYANGFGSYHC